MGICLWLERTKKRTGKDRRGEEWLKERGVETVRPHPH